MPTTKRDYYEILTVTREATDDEIKRSYRKLAVKFHPDKNPGDAQAEEQLQDFITREQAAAFLDITEDELDGLVMEYRRRYRPDGTLAKESVRNILVAQASQRLKAHRAAQRTLTAA